MSKEHLIELHIKKADLYADNPYQYHKLETAPFYFVPCVAEETHDEVTLIFDTEGLTGLNGRKHLRDNQKYSVLIQLLEARMKCPEYHFCVNPDNLFLDAQNRIRILNRDISTGTQQEAQDWFLDLKAFAGALFQRKYSYNHLKNGGLTLLKKRSSTKYLLELERESDALFAFEQAQKEAQAYDKSEYTYVKKKRYQRTIATMTLALAGFITAAGLGIYQNIRITVPQQKALLAERAYMEEDLTGVVDALAGVSVGQMDRHEKYILAVSFIRGQSVDTFQNTTKNLLISRLSYNGDENLLDYWIYLGRLEVDQALDVAQRISDNQLILYAYLQKLDQVSSDLTLSGEEKAQQTESWKGKIKSLAEELGIPYQEGE